MTDSAGSAENELKIYQESAEYALNELKETFTSLAQSTITRDFLKNLINSGTKLLETISDAAPVLNTLLSLIGGVTKAAAGLVDTIGLLPSILAGLSFKNIGVFKIVNKDATKLMDKFALFKKSFTDIRKDLKSGVGIRGFTSIVTSKDINLLKDFNSAIQSGTNYTKAFDTYLSNVPISIKRQGNELIQLNNQMLKLNNSYKNGKITKQEYNAQMSILRGRVNNVVDSTNTLTVSERIATGVTKGLGIALNLAFNIGIGIAINLIVTAIYKLINAQKEYNEKTKELAENIRQEKQEIKDLYKQYVDISKEYVVDKSKKEDLIKITDNLLEKLGHEKTTIQELVEEYGSLDNAIQNITYENLKEKRGTLSNARSVAENELKKQYNSINKPILNNYENYIRGHIGWNKFANDIGIDFLEKYRKWYLNKFSIENAEEFIKDTNEFISRLEDSYYQSDLEKIKIYSELVTARDNLKKSLDEYNSSVDDVNKNEAEMAVALARINTETPKTREEFNSFKKSIIDTVLASDDMKKHFIGSEKEIERSITSALKEMPEFAKFFADDLPDSINESDKAIKKLADTFEELIELIDNLIKKQEKLADAFKKIRLGSSLTAEEVYELSKEFEDIYKYIQSTSDGGYTISTDGFSALSNENIENEKETLQKNISEYKKQIAMLEALKQAAIDLDNSNGRDQALVDRFFQLSEATEELRESLGLKSMGEISKGLEQLQETLKQDELHLDVITSAFDKGIVNFYEESKSKISDLNNELKTFDSAVKILNEGNTLSYDEMVELVELAPDLQDFFTEMQDGYTISADKITEWREKSFEARNEYIQGLIEQAKTELQTAQDAKKAAEIVLNIQNKFGSAEEQLMAQVDLEAAEKKIKDILDVIEKYEALMGGLKYSDDSTKKVTDELQNKIDYYKTIISAIEIMRDKYSEAFEKEKEALENEKKALQDGKDALKEANDERQRELDLIEARNNLENAKKRKVWVYSEGSGFKQVQDKGAVKEAEEKYRDAITDIQEAEIDKKIDEIDKKIEANEKQQEAFKKSLEDMTKLEQNIEDAKTVEQAKTVLGLADEKDLLNLSDAVKEGIKNGLAEAIIEKDNEENKDNTYYKPADLNDVLKSLGATVTAEELKSMKSELPTEAVYNAAVKGFADSLKDFSKEAVQNVTNNNNGMVVSPTFNIYDASDPNKVAEVVNSEITNLLTRYNNSIK